MSRSKEVLTLFKFEDKIHVELKRCNIIEDSVSIKRKSFDYPVRYIDEKDHIIDIVKCKPIGTINYKTGQISFFEFPDDIIYIEYDYEKTVFEMTLKMRV